MIVRLNLYMIYFVCQWQFFQISTETVHGCTINNQQARSNKTSVTLSCANDGYILVQNLTFGVHKNSNMTCFYQAGDCTTRTTSIGLECNGLRTCQLDLNPQYLHICSQYSDYMVLDYLCLPGVSVSICDQRLISTSAIDRSHRLFIRSPNYPNEYENSLNCSCRIVTNRADVKFLDFSLEERDEMNFCTRDYLQIASQTYCDSMMDPILRLNTSTEVIFKSNDVITRKGFWLMIDSPQSMEVSCRSSFDAPFPTSSSLISTTMSTNTTQTHVKHRSTLSFILVLIIIFVVVLLLLNILLMILCWKQRQTKDRMKSESNHTHRPFFCSKRSETSSTSSITYGETASDAQKRQTTSTTTATTGIYEDPNEVLTLQRQLKFQPNSSFYFQHGQIPKTFCPIVVPPCSASTGYNPIGPIHCHMNTSAQTFYPLDSQHIYETIQDGHCPYQRLAATLRRQQQCTCYCAQHEHQLFPKMIDHEKTIAMESNPETLV